MFKKCGECSTEINTFDNTCLRAYSECPRKAYFQQVCGLRSMVTPLYFLAGRAWGEALMAFYDEAIPLEGRIKAGYEAIDKAFEGVVSDHPHRNPENLKKLFTYYIGYYSADVNKWKNVQMEVGFRFPLEEGINLGGSLDGIIEWEPYGSLVLENKQTLGYISEYSMAQFITSTQITTYLYALSMLRENVGGALVNYTSIKVPKTARGDISKLFSREIYTRNEADFEEYLKWVLDIAHRMKEEKEWPMYFHFCNGGYGLTQCLYYNICQANMGVPAEEVLFSTEDYKQQKWAPWERDGSN